MTVDQPLLFSSLAKSARHTERHLPLS